MRFSRILVVRACAIGDFILNLPALGALAGQEPDAQFTLVGHREYLEPARLFIPVEAIHSIEQPPWSSLFAGPVESSEFAQFDTAYVWMNDAGFAQNLWQSGTPQVFHNRPFPDAEAAPPAHAANHLLKTVGVPAPDLPDVWTSASDAIIVHPGSGSPSKCWPHFEELIDNLPNATVLLGPCESGFRTRAATLEALSLHEVAQELRRCRHFVGNDSGITHLAAYLGCPTLALFGPTDPRIWGPVGRRVEVLWKSPLGSITVSEVRRRLCPR